MNNVVVTKTRNFAKRFILFWQIRHSMRAGDVSLAYETRARQNKASRFVNFRVFFIVTKILQFNFIQTAIKNLLTNSASASEHTNVV